MKAVKKALMKGRNIYVRTYIAFRKINKKFVCKRLDSDLKLSHISMYSAGNMGDTVLSTCIRDLFAKELGTVSWRLMDLCGDVDDKYIKRLNETKGVIIGGHGAFLPDTHANDISNWEFACSAEQYGEIKSPIIVFAIGYNYFHGQERTQLFESNITKLVEQSAFFGLRNRGSIREIRSFLPEKLREKVVYQPCPTMIARMLYLELPEKKQTGKVAFNVAMDRADRRMGKNVDVILDQIARAVCALEQKGYETHFVAHMDIELNFIPYLRKLGSSCRIHAASTWDISHAARFYNDMDVVIGMRGHGIWIPFGVNCQIISLGNQMKTKWFLEDIHATDWFIDINEQSEKLSSKIVSKFEEIHEINGEETDARLHRAQQELYAITMTNMEQINRILTGRAKNSGGGYNRFFLVAFALCGERLIQADDQAVERRCGYAA